MVWCELCVWDCVSRETRIYPFPLTYLIITTRRWLNDDDEKKDKKKDKHQKKIAVETVDDEMIVGP